MSVQFEPSKVHLTPSRTNLPPKTSMRILRLQLAMLNVGGLGLIPTVALLAEAAEGLAVGER